MWQVVRDWLLNAMFPERCCGCGTLGSLLCPSCRNQLQFLLKPTRVPSQATDLDSITILTAFDPLSHGLIQAYKYQSVIGIGQLLAKLIYTYSQLPKLDLVTAVPLHVRKQSERGFNQAEILALELNKLSYIPYFPLLKRAKPGTTQAQLSRTRRWNENATVFSIQPFSARHCLGKNIGLIDDVFTTGATLQACAYQLKKAGAASVHGICFSHGQ